MRKALWLWITFCLGLGKYFLGVISLKTEMFLPNDLDRLKAFHLSTGWQCTRICHLCTGVGWHDPTDASAWVQGGPGPSPFKTLDQPFLQIPGCSHPGAVTLDYLHCFHLGYGCDMAASSVVLLARLLHFGRGGIDQRLQSAYTRFTRWCHLNHKVSSIVEFSKQKFDMSSKLIDWSSIWFSKLVDLANSGFIIFFESHWILNQGWMIFLRVWEEKLLIPQSYWPGLRRSFNCHPPLGFDQVS